MSHRTGPAVDRRIGRGFTLIELMIAVAIAALLAAVAYPSFMDAVRRSRRADAMSALTQLMQAQERWRTNNPTYQSTLASLPGAPTVSADGHYNLSLVSGSVSAQSYTAQATAVSTSPQYADSNCRVLQVAIAAGNITYSSQNAAGNANGSPDPCWVK